MTHKHFRAADGAVSFLLLAGDFQEFETSQLLHIQWPSFLYNHWSLAWLRRYRHLHNIRLHGSYSFICLTYLSSLLSHSCPVYLIPTTSHACITSRCSLVSLAPLVIPIPPHRILDTPVLFKALDSVQAPLSGLDHFQFDWFLID